MPLRVGGEGGGGEAMAGACGAAVTLGVGCGCPTSARCRKTMRWLSPAPIAGISSRWCDEWGITDAGETSCGDEAGAGCREDLKNLQAFRRADSLVRAAAHACAAAGWNDAKPSEHHRYPCVRDVPSSLWEEDSRSHLCMNIPTALR